MPVWFPKLVNKVVNEGTDVTKKLATVEREIVHTKKIGAKGTYAGDEVTVYRNLDSGNVRVEYGPSLLDEQGKIIRASNDNAVINLEYKAPVEDITSKGKPIKTKSEFSAVESEPEVVNWEGDIEFSGENVVNRVEDLVTDTSELQKYATGKKLTIKELSESMKKQKYKNKLETDVMEQVDYIENKGGGYASMEDILDEGKRVGDFDPKGYDRYNEWKGQNLPDKKIKKASGGRVPFIFGGSAGLKALWKSVMKNISKGRDKPIKKLFPSLSAEEKRLEKLVTGSSEQKAFREGEVAHKIEGIDIMINRLKNDKKILERQAKNKAMKDEGLDFIMKKMEESMPDVYGHLGKYTDIDKDILQLENIKKNLLMKGRKPNASGGLAYMLGE